MPAIHGRDNGAMPLRLVQPGRERIGSVGDPTGDRNRGSAARRYGAVLKGPGPDRGHPTVSGPRCILSFQISPTLIEHRFCLQQVPLEAGAQVLRAGGALFRLEQGTPLTATPIPSVRPDLSSRFRAARLTTRLLVLGVR